MGAATIIKGSKKRPSRRSGLARTILILYGIVIIPDGLPADRPPESIEARIQSCLVLRTSLEKGGVLEKDFAIPALVECPPDTATARLLEQTIQNGDFRHRKAALKALGTHLDRASLPFLIGMYYDTALEADQATSVFAYLSRLAEVGFKTPLRAIFREGISSPDKNIRIASILGLGRIEATEDWDSYLAPLAGGADPEITLNLLVAARLLRADAALALGQRHLRDPRPAIALAAMELLAALPGPRARESLLLLDAYRLPTDEPTPRLLADIIRRSAGATPDPGLSGVTLRRARLFAAPHDRSAIVGAVARDTIVYLRARERDAYRLSGDSAAAWWYRVETSPGLVGWMHASDLFAPPCVDAQCGFAAAAQAPAEPDRAGSAPVP